MLPLDGDIAKARNKKIHENAEFVNGRRMQVWDQNVHSKMKFFTSQGRFSDIDSESIFSVHNNNRTSVSSSSSVWKKITEITKSPQILAQKLNPMKVFSGSYSNTATVCALIGVINNDIKFSTDYIDRAIFPSNVSPHS
jgi:hypothetical protein